MFTALRLRTFNAVCKFIPPAFPKTGPEAMPSMTQEMDGIPQGSLICF